MTNFVRNLVELCYKYNEHGVRNSVNIREGLASILSQGFYDSGDL